MVEVFSIKEAHHQYGGGTLLVLVRLCSMDQSHHRYYWPVCAVQDYQTVQGGGMLMVEFIWENDLLQTNPL